MADNPTPQVVQPTVNWASLTQTILMAVIAGVGSIGTYQLSNRPTDIPSAPPAPAITAATLHEDNLRIEKKLDELLETNAPPTPKK